MKLYSAFAVIAVAATGVIIIRSSVNRAPIPQSQAETWYTLQRDTNFSGWRTDW